MYNKRNTNIALTLLAIFVILSLIYFFVIYSQQYHVITQRNNVIISERKFTYDIYTRNASYPPGDPLDWSEKLHLSALPNEKPKHICSTLKGMGDTSTCSITTAKNKYTITREGDIYTLLKDDSEVWHKQLIFTAYLPLRYVFLHNGNLVMAYDDNIYDEASKGYHTTRDIMINGTESMNQTYKLDESFNPTVIHNELVFFGKKKDNTHVVVYGKKIIALPYDLITDTFCCAVAMYAPQNDGTTLYFFAKRKNNWYHVKSKF